MSDHNLVSQEPHELDYILSLYGFEQAENNRKSLSTKIENFKGNARWKPHNRSNLYKYLEVTYPHYKKEERLKNAPNS